MTAATSVVVDIPKVSDEGARFSRDIVASSRLLVDEVSLSPPTHSDKSSLHARLQWHDVGYSVENRAWGRPKITASDTLATIKIQQKDILSHISGSMETGEVIALMGHSGSGKTTLLNILAGRTPSAGRISGSILYNDAKRTKDWRHIAAYVEQHAVMHEHLTVRETIQCAALLRLPKALPFELKMQRVEKTIDDLSLRACADTQIEKISGGERKRTSIGVELVTSPRFLFLDEPTSGLDSFTALSIVEGVHELAKREHKSILMTIHQPRPNIMKLFSKVLLLTKGREVFFGTVDEALQHFAALDLHCPPMTNPMDFILDNIIVDNRSERLKMESVERVNKLTAEWERQSAADSPGALRITSAIDNTAVAVSASRLQACFGACRTFARAHFVEDDIWKTRIPWYQQFRLLLHRNITDYRRFRAALLAMTFQTLILAILVSLIFWQMDFSQASIQNRIGVIFFLCTQQTFAFVMPLSVVFPTEKKMIQRERASVTYKISSAYVAKAVSVLPQALLSTVVLGTIVYWCIGLQQSLQAFLIFIAGLVSLVLCSQGLGMIIGAAVPTIHVALILGPMLTLFLVIMAGNMINAANIPAAFSWIQYVSPTAYAYKALMQNEFRDLSFRCSSDPEFSATPTASICFSTGDQVLQYFGLDRINIFVCIVALWCLALSFHVVAFTILKHKTKPAELE